MVDVIRSIAEGDSSALRDQWSAEPGVISLGTDPREWWEGRDKIVSLQGAQFAERGELSFAPADVRGFEEGNVGWAVHATVGTWRRRTAGSRFTAVFRREPGGWKLVHLHKSIAVANEDFGVRLTTTLDQIVDAVERERPSLGALSAAGAVTILFTDIEGSTSMIEAYGDEGWMRVLRKHNSIIRDAVSMHNGTEVKSQGDGFMLAFQSSEDAVLAAIQMQQAMKHQLDEAGVRVRIGLHTGEAVEEVGDFFGKSVVLAARIADEARGGEILVSASAREHLQSSGLTFGNEMETELKGFSGLHRISSVQWTP
jgi:adenylate cyclase